MTRREFVKSYRACLDAVNPNWRETMIRHANGRCASIQVFIRMEDGSRVGGTIFSRGGPEGERIAPESDWIDGERPSDEDTSDRTETEVRAGRCPNGCGPVYQSGDLPMKQCLECGYEYWEFRLSKE